MQTTLGARSAWGPLLLREVSRVVFNWARRRAFVRSARATQSAQSECFFFKEFPSAARTPRGRAARHDVSAVLVASVGVGVGGAPRVRLCGRLATPPEREGGLTTRGRVQARGRATRHDIAATVRSHVGSVHTHTHECARFVVSRSLFFL